MPQIMYLKASKGDVEDIFGLLTQPRSVTRCCWLNPLNYRKGAKWPPHAHTIHFLLL